MSADYKQRQPASDSSRNFLLGLFVGFLIGIGMAAAIAVYFFKVPSPFQDKSRPTETPAPAVRDAPKTAKAEEPKRRFDFYRILPGQEEPVTEKQLREAAKQTKKSDTAPKESFILQAGAFQSPSDADNLKARLAMLGMEATVQPTDLAEKGIWYRVRLGPYTNLDDINRIRKQLAQNKIEVTQFRIKDAPKSN